MTNKIAKERLAEMPAEDAAVLRKIYGKQLDKVVTAEPNADDEPQEGECCADSDQS